MVFNSFQKFFIFFIYFIGVCGFYVYLYTINAINSFEDHFFVDNTASVKIKYDVIIGKLWN